jgi:hypothetical protein
MAKVARNVSQDLNHVAESGLLEAGLSLHAGMMRANREDARQHLRNALDALDQAVGEVRMAIIDLDEGVAVRHRCTRLDGGLQETAS